MLPQFLKSKDFSNYYKYLAISIVFASLLPEYIAPLLLTGLFPFYWKKSNDNSHKVIYGRTAKILISYILYIFVSFIWAKEWQSSIITGIVWICAFFAFTLISDLSDSKEKIENIVLCFVGSAAVNAVISILQMAFMAAGKSHLFPNPLYRVIDEAFYNVVRYEAFFEETADRVTGCFDTPLVLATFFVIAFPLAAFCCFYASTKKRRIFSMLSCGLIFFGIMFTFLRGAVVAIILAFMILAFTGKKPAMVMSGVAAASAVVMLVVIFERRGVSTSQDISTSSRIHIWGACLGTIISNPLLGLGAGSDNVRDFLFENGMHFANAHNLYVEIIAENGIIGFCLFAALIVFTALDIVHIYRCGGWWKRFAVALVSSLVGFFAMSMFEHTLNTPKEVLYFAVILGCVEASKRVAQKHKEKYDIEPESMIKVK